MENFNFNIIGEFQTRGREFFFHKIHELIFFFFFINPDYFETHQIGTKQNLNIVSAPLDAMRVTHIYFEKKSFPSPLGFWSSLIIVL